MIQNTGKYSLHEPGPVKTRRDRNKAGLLRAFSRRFRFVNIFYIISGLSQVLLGLVVTMIAILNLIQPIWLAAMLSLFGCVVCMLGCYQVYEVYKNTKSCKDLARDAIERAINSRN